MVSIPTIYGDFPGGKDANGIKLYPHNAHTAHSACEPRQVHLADLALQLEGGRNRKGLSQAQRRPVHGRGWPHGLRKQTQQKERGKSKMDNKRSRNIKKVNVINYINYINYIDQVYQLSIIHI